MVKLIISALVFSVVHAQAFTLITTNPEQQGWASSEVAFRINTANCPIDITPVIENALAIWNNVANSKLKAVYNGSTTSTTYANPTTIYCETNIGASLEDSVPGYAQVRSTGGVLYEGVVTLNASTGDANIANFDQGVLTIILAHEIGHILGLGHSADINALMYYDGSYKNKLSLAQDDIDGISYLYPNDEFKDGHLMGCGTVGHMPPPPPPSSFLVLALLMLLPMALVVRFRNRMPKFYS